ncbi:MAG: 6,7-dimethyl-8-ribityllumazine synthase [Pseudomonadota bacterium]
MPKVYEGQISAAGKQFCLVVSRFNNFIGDRLVDGAVDALTRSGGVNPDEITIVKVPGAFELPLIAKKVAAKGAYHAVICLGAIIRGATPHFEYVSAEAAKGIAHASFETGVPIIFGLITADTLEQAIERAGLKAGNKGWDAAMAAMEMASLIEALG